MKDHKKSSFIYYNHYNNFEEYSEQAIRWNLDFKKISKGEFAGSVKMIDIGRIQIAETTLSGTIYQNGLTPIGYTTFAIPFQNSSDFKWFNYSVSSSSIMVFPKTNLIYVISYDDWHVYTVSIEDNYLQELIDEFELSNFARTLSKDGNLFEIDKTFQIVLGSYLKTIFRNLQYLSLDKIGEDIFERISYKLPIMLLKYLDKSNSQIINRSLRKRDVVMHNTLEYIQCNINNGLTINGICEDLNVKERTLEYAFNEYFNVGPKRFIKNLGLNNFRKTLLGQKISISEAAKLHKFKHLGQLSNDYRVLFNEVPSETTKRVLKKK